MTGHTWVSARLRLLPVVLALVLVGCSQSGGAMVAHDAAAVPSAGMRLTDLHDVGELRDVFNRDAGKPRLIMLVSPT